MNLRVKSIENLLVSKVRTKSLKYFLFNPTKSIHLRGAVREFQEEINAVRRELLRLEDTKLVLVEEKGNRKYFRLNLEHAFIPELLGIFHKAYGLGSEVIENEKRLGEIEFAALTPSYTRNAFRGEQRIDLIIIGFVDMSVLESLIGAFEMKTGREVHYSVMKPNEFEVRKRRKDQFLMNLMLQELTMLIGKYDDFARFS